MKLEIIAHMKQSSELRIHFIIDSSASLVPMNVELYLAPKLPRFGNATRVRDRNIGQSEWMIELRQSTGLVNQAREAGGVFYSSI
jgi:hypothetical protein